MVQQRDDIVGLDSAVILPRGRVGGLRPPRGVRRPADRVPVVPQAVPRRPPRGGVRGQARHPPETGLAEVNCPNCGNKGTFTEPQMFNGLMKTYLGPVETEEGLHYLRPETAQGIFVNFNNVRRLARRKPPFGIAQVGKSFRNEITPGTSSSGPASSSRWRWSTSSSRAPTRKWHEYWLHERWNWYVDLGLDPENLRFYEHPKEKLSHYSKRTVDIEYRFQLRRHGVRRARGHRQPDRLRPDHALQALRRRPVLLRPGQGRAVDAVRDRAGGRPHPRGAGVPARRVRRGRGARTPRAASTSARSCGSTRGWRRSRWRCCRCPATPTCRRRHVTWRRAAQALERGVRRRRRDRPALPAPGRDRHALLRHGPQR